jgi:hypothetical protein
VYNKLSYYSYFCNACVGTQHFILAGLKFLIHLCRDLGHKEATEYALELKKAEKAKEVRERIGSSRPGE